MMNKNLLTSNKVRYSLLAILSTVLISFSFTNCSGVGGFYLEDSKTLDLPMNHPSTGLDQPNAKIEPAQPEQRVAPATYVQEILYSLARIPNATTEAQTLQNFQWEALVNERVMAQRSYFGAPCDFYDKSNANDCPTILAAQGPYHRSLSVQRQSSLLRVCEELVENRNGAFLNQAILNLGGTNQEFTDKSIQSALSWFYRGRNPQSDLTQSLQAELQGLTPQLKWKLTLLAICQSTDWQAL